MPGPQDYWFIITGDSDQPGIDGGLMKSPDGATRTTNSIDVPAMDDYIKKVIENGGSVVVPKTVVPGMDTFAYCLDNQGLLFMYMKVNPNNYKRNFRLIEKP